ncbi:EAL domain-containing protein [Cupriavidus consociatus]|uniref:EAL domain-containing protein n=1 Tax=Cupriavidus consociatus TaxID=2821357 RepID=UPI001AEAD0E9|nr:MULTISPECIES: EAL domain-containing protein [unclassified Cupriavidus]MBP0624081.1 EAL domain-containing protein [Cupriavidus sp. LEh25]MDK2660790.1 EAL domain-containing protein [Cupriavidus sp. LEh21]
MTLSITECIDKQLLHAVFQPIGILSSGDILGYEALLRGPVGSALESPSELFGQAQRENCMVELEHYAGKLSVSAFAKTQLPGKLFLNFSAAAIRQIASCEADVRAFLETLQFPIERIVIELTEQSNPDPISTLETSIRRLRDAGVRFALDDFGTGNSNLGLWIALQPDYIKIDRSIVHGVSQSAFHLEAIRHLHELAKHGHVQLIAEGLETVEDLMVCRDIGITYAQGFILGKPNTFPSVTLHAQALAAVRAESIAVFPEAVKLAPRGFSASRLMISVPSVPPEARNNDVLDILARNPKLHAIAVVKDGRPVGVINRRNFVDAYALPYHRELFGKKSCLEFSNESPVIVERTATMEQLAHLLSAQDQRYISDGLVIVDQGQYVGLATGEDLVRSVTEVRIEAARYANPLTFLPGNIPIDAHIKRLIESDAFFYACYCDLNSFKPFNDVYGYWQGDEMLKLAATILGEACDTQKDFLGHVGGDDFLILYQSEDWERRLRAAMAKFDANAVHLYTPADIEAGGILAEDRHGNPRFYGFVSMAVGVVPVKPGANIDADAIATLAAEAKRVAKRSNCNFFCMHSLPA